MLMKLQREQRGRKLFFQNYKSCYKPKFRHIKRQWVKQSGNLSQKSQKVLWNQNLTCSLVWSYVLMHNGQAKKNQPQTQTENKACLHPQCNFGGTWPPQSTGSFETWTSQSSSKVIGIKIFATKHTRTRFHCWRPERVPNISAPLRPFLVQPSVPRWQEKVSSRPKAIYVGFVVVPPILLFTPALIYSQHDPARELSQENLTYKKIPPSSWVSWVCSCCF